MRNEVLGMGDGERGLENGEKGMGNAGWRIGI